MLIFKLIILVLCVCMGIFIIYNENKKKKHKKRATKLVFDLFLSNIHIKNFTMADFSVGTSGTLVVSGANDANESQPVTNIAVVSSDPSVYSVSPHPDGDPTHFAWSALALGSTTLTATGKNSVGADLTLSEVENVVTQPATKLVFTFSQP